ncbi:MAG: hypothetical protein ACM36C_01530 [Acidobacteriota bacterium]
MNLNDWLAASIADAKKRGLDELVPILESLAAATRILREAPWDQDARRD